jgi:hypothetical protein
MVMSLKGAQCKKNSSEDFVMWVLVLSSFEVIDIFGTIMLTNEFTTPNIQIQVWLLDPNDDNVFVLSNFEDEI